MEPIWRDIIYSGTSDSKGIDAYIYMNDQEIYHNRLFPLPDGHIDFNLSRQCEKELNTDLPDFTNMTDNLVHNDKAVGLFTLKKHIVIDSDGSDYSDGSNYYGNEIEEWQTLIERYLINDWSYTDYNTNIFTPTIDNYGNRKVLSNPINGHMDNRMKLFYTISREPNPTLIDKYVICQTTADPLSAKTITYTTNTGEIIPLTNPQYVDAKLVSNTYENVGSMEFEYQINTLGPQFISNSAVTSIILPEVIMELGNFAFSGNTNLSGITLPSSLQSMGQYTFEGCSALTSIDFSNTTIQGFPQYTFYRCYSLTSVIPPSQVNTIGTRCFEDCISLTSLTLSNTKIIGNYAFNNCRSLQSITLPDTVIRIGGYAFRNCTSLQSISIPSGVTILNGGLFYDCTSLSQCVLPNSIEEIKSYVFRGCSNLSAITYNGTIAEFKNIIGYTNLELGYIKYVQCTNGNAYLYDFIIDLYNAGRNDVYVNDITDAIKRDLLRCTITNRRTIVYYAEFMECPRLIKVEIGDNVESIGTQAFMNCPELSLVIIRHSVTEIKSYAFYGCPLLVDLWYDGTMDEFESIDKGNMWKGNIQTVHCNDGDLDI